MWNVVYAQWWDAGADEWGGQGNCLGSCSTLERAEAAALYYAPEAARLWPPGLVAVTGPDHGLACAVRTADPGRLVSREEIMGAGADVPLLVPALEQPAAP